MHVCMLVRSRESTPLLSNVHHSAYEFECLAKDVSGCRGLLQKLIIHYPLNLCKFEAMVINMDHCMDRDFPEHMNNCIQHYPLCAE